MAVGLKSPGELHPVAGLRLASMHCGIKADPEIRDLALIEAVSGSSIAAVFTRNRFCAAPVTVARRHLKLNSSSRYLLVNSGNANAGTGVAGIQAATSCCAAVAEATRVGVDAVLPFSTGVIASPLPSEKIQQAVPELVSSLDNDNWLAAAEGIMTTDTLPKAFSEQIQVQDKIVTLTGIAKGSGMIKPDMATMLSFIATDAEVDHETLQVILNQVVKTSFF